MCVSERSAASNKKRQLTRILYLLGFLDMFGIGMLLPFLPRMIKLLGFSHFIAGVLGSLYGALQIFSSTLMGKLSDIQGRKGVYVLSFIGPAISYMFIGISSTAICLVAARVIAGLLKHGLSTGKAVLTDITPPKELSKTLGYYQAISNAGFIVGPALGGYLIDRDPSYALAAYACSSMFFLNGVLSVVFVPSDKSSITASGDTDEEQKSYISLIFDSKHFSTHKDLIILRFMLTFAVLMLRTNFSIFITEKFGIDTIKLGYIISFNGIIGTLSSANVGNIASFYTSQTTLLKHLLFLLSLSLIFISLSPTIALVIVGLVPLSIATSNLRVCLTNLLLARASSDEKGALIGLSYSVSSLSRMISPTLVGILQEINVTLPCYVSGLSAITATLMSVIVYPLPDAATIAKKEK